MEKRLQSRLDLDTQNQIYKTIFYQSTDGILIIEDGMFVECNNAVVKMLRYESKEQFLHTHPSELSPKFQPDGRSSYEKAEENTRVVLESGSRTFEWVHQRADGTEFWVEVVLTDISTDEKVMFLVVWRDIDARKKLEAQLKELNATLEKRVQQEVEENRHKDAQLYEMSKMAQMGEMIENIAHQWRQPLSAISAIASNVNVKCMLGSLEEEKLPAYMQDIEQYAQFLSKTIDTFRNFIKEERVHKEVLLQESIEETLHIINATVKANNIELITEMDSHPMKTTMLSGTLSQVLINIINNAKDVLIEKKIESPWIKLRLEEREHKAVITIEDNGGGIPETVMPKIFDLYFTTKEKSQGSGLGLHMSHKMVCDSLHGELYAENTQNGAKFFIVLPL